MTVIEISDRIAARIEKYLAGRYKDVGIDEMLEKALDDMDAGDACMDEINTRIGKAMYGCAEG